MTGTYAWGSKLIKLLTAVLLLAYPFFIVFGLKNFGINYLAPILITLFVLRILLIKDGIKELAYLMKFVAVVAIFLSVASWGLKKNEALLYYPVVVSSAMLSLFLYSLYRPPTIIERFARLQYAASGKEFPEEGIRYTRKVTVVWCGFFVFNGAIALGTVLYNDITVWMYYNGAISYILMGILFLSEWILRQRIIKKIG